MVETCQIIQPRKKAEADKLDYFEQFKTKVDNLDACKLRTNYCRLKKGK